MALSCWAAWHDPDNTAKDEAVFPDADQIVAVVLVHGFPTATGGEAEGSLIGHAWIEVCYRRPLPEELQREGCPESIEEWVVWDAVMATRFPLAYYYWAGRIDPDETARFTSSSDVLEALVQTGHIGNWADETCLREEPCYAS